MAFVISSPGCTFVRSLLTRNTCVRRRERHALPVSNIRASIEREVSQRMKEAMKSKDAAQLKALRGIRAAFLTALKQEGADDSLSDEAAIAQLRKLSKMRKESITMFREGGRDDLADAEEAELAVIEQWLPSLAGEEQTIEWAKDAIERSGASKPGDMGKVMGLIMREHKQEVDGKLVKDIVSKLLAAA